MTIYHTPFTYLIGWKNHDIWYYGVRYAKGCKPEDLWLTYFTSSAKVCQLRNELGEPDVIEVRRIFADAKAAKKWEEKVLRRLDVLNTDRWLNANIGGTFNPLRGKDHPSFGTKWTDEFRTKVMTTRSSNNYSHNESTRRKISESRKGYNHSPEAIQKIKEARKNQEPTFAGKVHSEEAKKRMSATRLANQKIVTCPHCAKTGAHNIMARWHFDNCKSREPI